MQSPRVLPFGTMVPIQTTPEGRETSHPVLRRPNSGYHYAMWGPFCHLWAGPLVPKIHELAASGIRWGIEC